MTRPPNGCENIPLWQFLLLTVLPALAILAPFVVVALRAAP